MGFSPTPGGPIREIFVAVRRNVNSPSSRIRVADTLGGKATSNSSSVARQGR
jgi:hypothetical protein